MRQILVSGLALCLAACATGPAATPTVALKPTADLPEAKPAGAWKHGGMIAAANPLAV